MYYILLDYIAHQKCIVNEELLNDIFSCIHHYGGNNTLPEHDELCTWVQFTKQINWNEHFLGFDYYIQIYYTFTGKSLVRIVKQRLVSYSFNTYMHELVVALVPIRFYYWPDTSTGFSHCPESCGLSCVC